MECYLSDISNKLIAQYGKPNRQSNRELIRRINECQDPEEKKRLKEILALVNFPCVKQEYRRISNPLKNNFREDIFQVGMMVMTRCIDEYDESLGYEFVTYARKSIAMKFLRIVDVMGSKIHVPVYYHDDIRLLRMERDGITVDHKDFKYPPGTRNHEEFLKRAEIATRFDLFIPFGGRADLKHGHRMVIEENTSLDPIKSGCRESDMDDAESYRFVMGVAREHLSDKWLDIFMRSHGIEGYSKQTLREIAEVHGVSRERVRQIVDRSMKIIQRGIKWSRLKSAALPSTGQTKSRKKTAKKLLSHEQQPSPV